MPPTSHTDVHQLDGVAAKVAVVAWRSGVVAAAAAVAVTAGEVGRRGLPVIVLGQTVIHQLHVVLTLVTISLLALVLSGIAIPDGPRRRLLPRVLIGLTTCAAVAACAGSAFVSAVVADTWTVLAPPSPTGCRVVAAEYSFLLRGSHRGYALPAGAHVVDAGSEPVVRWTGDDGYQPVSSGRYELTWDGETATLFFPEDDEAWFSTGLAPTPRHDDQIPC
jgi:hypothetical protein